MLGNTAAVEPLYKTPYGLAYVGDSLRGMEDALDEGSVSLFFTSPPFALSHAKEYGNKHESEYISWFSDFARLMWRKLRDDGSLVIDLGGTWKPGHPTRSLYQFKLLIALCEGLGDHNYHLAQEFYWYNPSKMPLPAQWVNVERLRVKDSVNVIWWLSKTTRPKADNRKILTPYSRDMEALLRRQTYNGGVVRPGGARVGAKSWKTRHEGAIPPNVIKLPYVEGEELESPPPTNFLTIGGSESASRYHRSFKALEHNHVGGESLRGRFRKHPARFPVQLPSFFIRFLTDANDLVVDPFAGSNVTGQAAEESQRRWRAFEMHRYYLEPSLARFDAYFDGRFEWLDPIQPLLDKLGPDQLTG